MRSLLFSYCEVSELLDIHRDIVQEEVGRDAALRAVELDDYLLPFIGGQVEGVLHVTRARTQVRVGCQRCESDGIRTEQAHDQRVVGDGRRLGCVDVQLEGQSCRRDIGRYRDSLTEGGPIGTAGTAKPGLPRTGESGFTYGVVEDTVTKVYPGRRVHAVLETGVYDQLRYLSRRRRR